MNKSRSKGEGVEYGSPTGIDMVNSFNYALQQISKMKCQDPDILKKYCPAGRTDCLKWIQDDNFRMFPKPSNITTKKCVKDSDCDHLLKCIPNPSFPNESKNELVCGYKPDVASGVCRIMNGEMCNGLTKIPYVCPEDGPCIFPKQEKLSYVEWHPNEGKDGKGRCVLGNFLLREWCEEPKSRCTQNKDGSYPSNCTGGEKTPGVTDSPPFYYDINTGKCFMTQGYCSRFGTKYKSGADSQECNSSEDCGEGNYCYFDKYTGRSFCTGPKAECDLSTGEKIGEMTLGKTLFQAFHNPGSCNPVKELFGMGRKRREEAGTGKGTGKRIKEMFRNFGKDFSEVSCALADSNFIKRKEIIGRNFAGEGIHLYLIFWNDKIQNAKETVGFIHSEVQKKYPEIVKEIKGKMYVCLEKEEIKGDKGKKRIYCVIQSRRWMVDMIIGGIMSTKI